MNQTKPRTVLTQEALALALCFDDSEKINKMKNVKWKAEHLIYLRECQIGNRAPTLKSMLKGKQRT